MKGLVKEYKMKKVLIGTLLVLLMINGCDNKVDNDGISAVDDMASVETGHSVNIEVLKNDGLYDFARNIKSVSTPLHGTAIIETNKTVTYTPEDEFSGTDTFTYVLKVSKYTDKGKVTVSVTNPAVPDNQAPTANAGEDKVVVSGESVTLTGTDADSDGSITSREWKEGASSLAQTQSFEYTSSDVGIHTLIYTVTDDDGAKASNEMHVNVTEVVENHKPVANVSTVNMHSDCSLGKATLFTLTGSDDDDNSLTFETTTNPTYGSVTLSSEGAGTFTLDDSEAQAKCMDGMPNSFNFKVNDGTVDSDEAVVTIVKG
jgi:VCBS repeat-containing protein